MKKNNEIKKKRVLFIVASLIRAGAETQVVDLINSLDNNKLDKFLFTFHKRIDLYDKLDHEKIRFYNQHRKHKFDLSIVKTIARIVDSEKIDIVHCTNLFSLLMGWLSVKLAKRSPHLLVAIHTTITRSMKHKFFEKFVFQWALRECDNVIFVCEKQAEYWEAKYRFLKEKFTVIYNGVDIDHYDAKKFQEKGMNLRHRLSIPTSACVICCIARFHKEKAHEDLIKAFSSLKDTRDNVYLLLAGSGPRKQHIEILVKKGGLENNVKFLGELSDVRTVLAASDISVLASTAVETFSMAMLESMSMGVPMVATDIGGLSEAIISGETGELVPLGDPAMLARGIYKLIDDKERYFAMKKKCRELVAQKFTTGRMVSTTEKTLLSVNYQK